MKLGDLCITRMIISGFHIPSNMIVTLDIGTIILCLKELNLDMRKGLSHARFLTQHGILDVFWPRTHAAHPAQITSIEVIEYDA